MTKEEEADVIGDSLIPVINKLQDIFSQVWITVKHTAYFLWCVSFYSLQQTRGSVHPHPAHPVNT